MQNTSLACSALGRHKALHQTEITINIIIILANIWKAQAKNGPWEQLGGILWDEKEKKQGLF